MRILHLSDLHVTFDGRTLDDLWLVAERAIERERFDFVVVSGDLTQRAAQSEYDRLHRFLEDRIEPLVRAPDDGPVKPRIIIVPGNHDVDWGADVFEPVILSHSDPEQLKAWMRDAAWKPETTPYRVQLGPLGHASLFKIRDALYSTRFANVDRFLKDYYGDTLGPPHHRFDLLDPSGVGDWSAHVFPKERIAFLGFNSCHRNDRYWHGAYIHPAAVRHAKDHLDRQPEVPGLVRVAVWHHGLESHRSRPDRLTLDNLGVLLSADTTVGFHGHVHESVAEVHRFISDDFALVSTGTLGAASDDRPDAIGNQFSVVDLHWNRLRIDVYERVQRYGEYDKRHSRFMYFDLERQTDPSRPMRSWAGKVTRRVTLDEKHGIATVDLEIRDLYLTDPVVLARFDRRLCCVGDPQARADGKMIDVGDATVGGTHREFRFAGRIPVQHYNLVTWRYRLANSLAVNRAELELLPDRLVAHPHLEAATQEAWSHIVQFDYDQIEMVLRFSPDGGEHDYLLGIDGSYDVSPIVERRIGGPQGTWERVPAEESRAQLAATGAGFTIAWSSPMAAYRYGAMYRMQPAGRLVPRGERALVEMVLQKCRSTLSGAQLRDLLTQHMANLVRAALRIDEENLFGEHLMGVGYLWSSADRALRPCFGHFPPDAWSTTFSAGRGVAGHAFRFDRPAAWHRAAPGSLDVIKAPTPTGGRDYQWILCLPILVEPTGKSIGVISFAATTNDTEAATELSSLSHRFAMNSKQIEKLWLFLNLGFWHSLELSGKEHPGLLPRDVLHFAARCKQSFLDEQEPTA